MEETKNVAKGAVATPRRSRNNYRQKGQLTEADVHKRECEDGLSLAMDDLRQYGARNPTHVTIINYAPGQM